MSKRATQKAQNLPFSWRIVCSIKKPFVWLTARSAKDAFSNWRARLFIYIQCSVSEFLYFLKWRVCYLSSVVFLNFVIILIKSPVIHFHLLSMLQHVIKNWSSEKKLSRTVCIGSEPNLFEAGIPGSNPEYFNPLVQDVEWSTCRVASLKR